ncbi:MAG: hypothetical protein INR64_02955 [Caulobacteraceae bacterium]|nr:hypothetical protein [Caulobacter sp.]
MSLAPPGSTLWLLRNELRLGLRAFAPARKGRAGAGAGFWVRMGLLAVIAVAMVVLLGAPLALWVRRSGFQPNGPYFLLVDVAAGAVFTLMLAQALNTATQVLYERNDLDLLLSSPTPAARILTVRGLGMAILASALYLVLASLVVLPLAAVGEVRWLAALVVILCMGLLAAAGGLLIAMGLFAVLGPRRTRLAAQVLAAAIGVSIFLASQARNFLPSAMVEAIGRRIATVARSDVGAASPLTWIGRAVAGEPLPLVLAVVLGGAAFLLVTRLLGRRFGDNASAAAGVGDASPRASARRTAGADRLSFRGGVFATLVRKERRLLVRDPWLISQVLLQVVYMLPLGLVILKNTGAHMQFALAGGAAAAAFICGQLGGNLTWLTVSAEDSPELLATAPISPLTAARAKLLVAVAPVMALAVLPVAVIGALSPWAAIPAALGCAAAALSAGLVNIWRAKPGQRRDFRKRRQGSVLVSIAEMLMLFCWGGATWLATAGMAWAAIPAALALLAMLALRRPIRLVAE